MKVLFLITGRSNSGKSTLANYFRTLLADSIQMPTLSKMMISPIGAYRMGKLYTTRSPRENESIGFDAPYNFVTPEYLAEHADEVIESRFYDAAYGKVAYATLDDGNLFWDTYETYEDRVDANTDNENHVFYPCIPVTILDTQIDSYIDIYNWVQIHNEKHPEDPFLVVCLYLYASTDTLLKRSYDREREFPEEKQNWKEVVRRIISEIDDSNGLNYHVLIHQLIQSGRVSRHSSSIPQLQGVQFFPKHIARSMNSMNVPLISILSKDPLFGVRDDCLPPFFNIIVDYLYPTDIYKMASKLIEYILIECVVASKKIGNADISSNHRVTNNILYQICKRFRMPNDEININLMNYM